MLSLLGWIGNVLLVWSCYEIGNKKRYAHLLGVMGEVLWVIKSLIFSQYDLLLICAIFGVLSARSWFKWGKSV